jgi:NitT/TauT family transport system ATP-binding protein
MGTEDGAAAPDVRLGRPKLRVESIHITYPTDTGQLLAIDELTFDIAEGEFVALVGPSGCGKSTFVKALNGLVPIDSGVVEVDGVPDRGSDRDRALVFQEPRLLPWRTAAGNIAFALEARGAGRKEAHRRALEELQRVNLVEFADAYPAQLSGGMQQRVNLARALATDPVILSMDEPFAALDAQTRETMQRELLSVWERRRTTTLFITHQVDEALYLADRVLVLSERPARVVRVIDVPFSRPRPLSIKRSVAFHALEDEIWAELGGQPVPDVELVG